MITLAAGKETQREYTLRQSLLRLGVRDVVMSPLFRTRRLILFLLRLQGSLLLSLGIRSLWRRLYPLFKRRYPRLAGGLTGLPWLMTAALLGCALSSFPLNPSTLPVAFTAEAIGQKLGELLILWNNRIRVISMETSYLSWLFRLVCALSGVFWICLIFFPRKRRDCHA